MNVMNVKRKHDEDSAGEKRKGRKKGFVWSHVLTDEEGKVTCMHCGDLIKVNFGEKVERLRKHFIKSCTKSPFQKDSKEYEELLECVSSPPIEQKKKAFAGKAKNSNKVICYNIDFVSSVLAGSYSMLTPDQIFLLEAQGNRSSNWGGVKLLCPAGVSFDSSLDKIRGCYFNGNIFIGLFVKTTMMSGGVSVISGLYNSNFSGNCVLSDNCYVWNTAMLMNVYVGRNSCVVGCGSILGEGHTSFGTSRSIKIGCEGPGTSAGTGAGVHREVLLSVRSTFADMCGSVFLRQDRNANNDDAMEGGKVMDDGFGMMAGGNSSQHASLPIGGGMNNLGMMGQQGHPGMVKPKRAKYNRNDGHVRFDMTIICDDVELISCTSVRNSFIGSYSHVRDSTVNSSTALAHCEISSAHLVDAVMHQSCRVLTGAQLNGVLMFPHSNVSAQAKITDTVLGPDTSVSIGECHNSLLGPHTGFHHQSLLIASSWPMGRGNIGYGAKIGANHTSRSNDQEAFPGEGMFFGLGSSVSFPFNGLNSPYTIVANNTTCLPQKISFPFSLMCNPDVPYPIGPAGSVKATSLTSNNNTSSQVQLTSTMSCLKPGWVLISNPYFLEKSINKFSRRRRSSDYRTDLPIFRPSIADMVADARNRLLKFKEAQMQSHGRILTPATLAAMLLTDRQLKGAGQCVVSGTSVDPAIDAYTQFLHRYALHGLLYLSAMAAELPPTSLLPGAGAEEPTTEPLDTLLADVRAMQAGLPSMGDHLHQLSAGSTAPPANSSAKASASVYSCAEPAASETPSMGASMLLGSAGSAGCCLLTDTHNPAVRAHQMRVLSEEFPDVDVSAYFQSPSNNPNANKVRQLLKYLCELEQAYAERVRVCKQKDAIRAAEIIPDYISATHISSMNMESGEGLQEDEMIESARSRAAEVVRCVHTLIA
mmetsp:Transcript_108495/g.212594  ORF Transcript_108495/g.212594 Transcript_108495/m.212594 type:complete len:928 (+) Transcript_108495:64-2847(+)